MYRLQFQTIKFYPHKNLSRRYKYKKTYEITYNETIPFEKVIYDYDANHKVHIHKDAQSQIDNVIYSITHKKECWKYEEEYRGTFFDFDKVNYPGQIISTKLFYSDNILSEIIFGNKLSIPEIEEIKNLIRGNYSNNVNFYIINADLQNGKLIKVPI